MKIIDDGVGFKVGVNKAGSYGLRSIQERVHEIGGTLKVLSFPNKGTQIEVKVPIMIERGRIMIKVLLVDDHEMVRMGVSAYLSTQPDIEVVGEAENGRKGSELALQLRPDIILMDLVMDEMDGVEATRAIIQEWPEAKL